MNDPNTLNQAASIMRNLAPTLFLFLFNGIALWSQGLQFTEHAMTAFPSLLRDIKAVDMDGDGDQDALVTGGSRIVWYRNADGNGTFDSLAIVISADVANLNVGYAADSDGDGDKDVLVGTGTSSSNSEVAWFRNLDGVGTAFSTKITLTTLGDEFREVIAADLDGDLDQDILYGSYESDQVSWLENTGGAGTFSAPTTLYSNANGIRFIRVADADGDDDLDFFSSSYFPVSTGQFSFFRNSDGMGSFVRENVNNLDGQNAAGIAVGDVDGDGDVDLVGALYNSDVVYRYNNNGNGSFSSKITVSSALNGPFSLELADLDGDADLDLVAASEVGNKISYLLNNGTGTFSAPVTISTALSFTNASFASSRLVATTDLDSDGDIDILAISTSQKISWFEQTAPLALSFQTLDPLCSSSADGAIFIEATGGLAPYAYVWSDSLLQGDSLLGLSAGTYQLTLTDQAGDQIVQDFTLTAPPPIELVTVSTPSVDNQNNGTAAVAVSGGVAPYTYLWNNEATTDSLANLAVGTYFVTVTDANGCTQTNSVVVDQTVAVFAPDLSTIAVWPNPAHEWIALDLSRVINDLDQIDLLNAKGQLLRRLQHKQLQTVTMLNWEGKQNSGFVIVVLYGRNGEFCTRKILIE